MLAIEIERMLATCTVAGFLGAIPNYEVCRQMAEDVIGWMEARNLLGKCFCFGHSLGGSVAGHIEVSSQESQC